LPGDFAQAGMVAAEQFGVPEGKGGKQGEADTEDQGDDRQSAVGHRLGAGAVSGPVAAGMEEAVRERPVLGEVVPSIVLDFQRLCPSCRTRGPEKTCGSNVSTQTHW